MRTSSHPHNREHVRLQLARAVCGWRAQIELPPSHADKYELGKIAELNTRLAEYCLTGGRGQRRERLFHAAVMALLESPRSHRIVLCACLAAMECVKGAVAPDESWMANALKAARAEFAPFADVHHSLKGGAA